jgi:signal transduction histidine kinase
LNRVHRERDIGEHAVAVLTAGFAFLILLLAGAAYIAVGVIYTEESRTVRLVEEERAAARIIEAVHRNEDSLNSILYGLAADPTAADRQALGHRLDFLERSLRETVAAGFHASHGAHWTRVQRAADAFFISARDALQSSSRPGTPFFEAHEELNKAVAALATAKFEADAAAEQYEIERSRTRIRYVVGMLIVSLVVAIFGAVLTVMVTSAAVRRARWQAAELGRLSSRAMSDFDALARRFSRELHDQFGQTLNAIEANLVALQNSRTYNSGRIEDCLGLVKDGIASIRETSQLLRPSILDDFGLDESLRWLAETFTERTGIQVSYHSDFSGRMATEIETQVFRIAQEALTNVGRHSRATEARLDLRRDGEIVRLNVADNGTGFEPRESESGLGLAGMRARARSAKGILLVDSKQGRGARISLEIPFVPEAA